MAEKFTFFAFAMLALYSLSQGLFYFGKKSLVRIGLWLFALPVVLNAVYIGLLWFELGREPMRTLGETRLWYSFFVGATAIVLWYRWKLKWIPGFAALMASLFILLNLLRPENFDKALMPALQSYWFAPHVIVYIFGYSILAVAALVSLRGLWLHYFRKKSDESLLRHCDQLVYVGFPFLTAGLLFGALWAKQAWGHYWTWDPKETWAFITWLLYLMYMHFRHRHPRRTLLALWILALAYVVLLICWFGLNLLASAANSVHVYS